MSVCWEKLRVVEDALKELEHAFSFRMAVTRVATLTLVGLGVRNHALLFIVAAFLAEQRTQHYGQLLMRCRELRGKCKELRNTTTLTTGEFQLAVLVIDEAIRGM